MAHRSCRRPSGLVAADRGWVAVTSQYLVGEVSWWLARLRACAADGALAGEVARLRREAETCPLPELGSVLRGALRVADAACWCALVRGDTAAFARQVEASRELYGFGLSADLLD